MASASDRTTMLKYQCLAADKWSRFPAIHNVDMGCYSITNLGNATFCDGTYMGPGSGGSFDISSNNDIKLVTGATTVTVDSASANVTVSNAPGANTIVLDAAVPSATVSNGTNTSALYAGYATASLPPVAADQLTRKDYVDSLVGSIPASFRPTNMYYVAKNGNNGTGDGSYSKPWLTVQHAINQLEAIPLTAATQAVVNLAPGHYVENLTFTNGYISIVSPMNANDVNEVVEIEGNVLINITAGAADLFNKQVIFQGIQITGSVTDTSTIQHTLMLQDCYLYGSDRLLYQNCTVDNRTRIYNCQINSSSPASTVPCVEIASGDAYLERIDFDYNGLAPVLKVSGTGAAFASLCDFTNSSASSAAPGIKVVYVTSTRGSSFGNSLFRFSNSAAKTNANGFYCLFYEPPALPGAGIAVLYCTFIATGMDSSQNVAASTGTGAPLPGPLPSPTSALITYGGCFSAPGLSNGNIGGWNAGIPVPGVPLVHKLPFTAVS